LHIDNTPIHVVTAGDSVAPGVSVLARAYGRGVHLGLHVHKEAQLVYAARGVVQVTTPKGRWLVPPERAVWVPPRLEHAIDVLADIDMRTLYVEPWWLQRHREASRLTGEFVVQVGTLLRAVMAALFEPGADAERIELLAKVAMFELRRAEDPATFVPMPRDPRARRAAEILLADPAAPHSLSRLADAAGSSERTLTRVFATDTKLTFKEWRQRVRIMAAVEALGRDDVTIKDVALRLGFSSTAAFGHAFKQVMGTTPGAFLARGR
jgi:AraC-like DNA-binding protein